MTATISVNGAARQIADGCTLTELLATMSSATTGVAVAVNEAVIPRPEWPVTALGHGDRVEVLTAVQGG